MKKLFLVLFAVIAYTSVCAQVYTDPTTNNVGVSTTHPNAPLEVVQPSDASVPVRLFGGTTSTALNKTNMLAFMISDTQGGEKAAAGIEGISNNRDVTGGYLSFLTSNGNIYDPNGLTERMRIDAAGNVGIGTTTTPTVGNYGVLALNGRSSSNGGYLSLMTNGTEAASVYTNTQLNVVAASGLATQFYTGSTPTLQISSGGNVLINQISQANAGYKLDVNGSIRSNAVVVNTSGADFVFNRNYHLNSLVDLEQYIDKNHHLPEIKSAEEMQKEGMNVGELNTKLLQKVEELTLYLIDKDKQVQQQQMQLILLQDQIDQLKKQITGAVPSLNKN